jgi:hypothetical protein
LREDESFVKGVLNSDVLQLLDQGFQFCARLEIDFSQTCLSHFQSVGGVRATFPQIAALENLGTIRAFGYPARILLLLNEGRGTITTSKR